MPSDPNTMTLDEIRDWLAARAGCVKVKDSHGGDAWRHKSLMHDPYSNWTHPFPPTLDAAAEAMPKRWWYEVHIDMAVIDKVSCGAGTGSCATYFAHGDTEILARFRLAMLCILAEESKP